MRLLFFAFMIFVSVMLRDPAQAAEFRRLDVQNLTFIFLRGPIVEGDFKRLRAAVPAGRQVVLVLNSPGGLLIEGIQMGEFVRMRGVSTAVLDGHVCMSSCVIVWLAGIRRYMTESSVLGAHAAYEVVGEGKRAAGMGNALLGAYLNQLGLSLPAIAYLTRAGPDEYLPVTPQVARKLGLEVIVLDDDNEVARSSASPVQRVRDIFEEYFVIISLLPQRDAVRMLARRVGRKLKFYGKVISRKDYLRRQVKYALRWPLRMYVPNSADIRVHCREGVCLAVGLVDWLAANKEKGRLSVGRSVFELGVDLQSGTILYIGGKVLKAKRMRGLKNVDRQVKRLKEKRFNFRAGR